MALLLFLYPLLLLSVALLMPQASNAAKACFDGHCDTRTINFDSMVSLQQFYDAGVNQWTSVDGNAKAYYFVFNCLAGEVFKGKLSAVKGTSSKTPSYGINLFKLDSSFGGYAQIGPKCPTFTKSYQGKHFSLTIPSNGTYLALIAGDTQAEYNLKLYQRCASESQETSSTTPTTTPSTSKTTTMKTTKTTTTKATTKTTSTTAATTAPPKTTSTTKTTKSKKTTKTKTTKTTSPTISQTTSKSTTTASTKTTKATTTKATTASTTTTTKATATTSTKATTTTTKATTSTTVVSSTFTCQSGFQTIPLSKKCDGTVDCLDQTDELNNDCCSIVGFFACNAPVLGGSVTVACIPNILVCNQQANCAGGADETVGACLSVGRTTPAKTTTVVSTVAPSTFTCATGLQTISISKKCDGKLDCLDGTDELNNDCCSLGGFFACNAPILGGSVTVGCIPGLLVCDNKQDCSNGADEAVSLCATIAPGTTTTSVITTTAAPTFSCLGGGSIPISQKCDGTLNCADGSDELNNDCCSLLGLNVFLCTASIPGSSVTVSCIPSILKCDGKNDCVGGVDETIALCGLI